MQCHRKRGLPKLIVRGFIATRTSRRSLMPCGSQTNKTKVSYTTSTSSRYQSSHSLLSLLGYVFCSSFTSSSELHYFSLNVLLTSGFRESKLKSLSLPPSTGLCSRRISSVCRNLTPTPRNTSSLARFAQSFIMLAGKYSYLISVTVN